MGRRDRPRGHQDRVSARAAGLREAERGATLGRLQYRPLAAPRGRPPPSRPLAPMSRYARFLPDRFTLFLVITVLIASVLPARGASMVAFSWIDRKSTRLNSSH